MGVTFHQVCYHNIRAENVSQLTQRKKKKLAGPDWGSQSVDLISDDSDSGCVQKNDDKKKFYG